MKVCCAVLLVVIILLAGCSHPGQDEDGSSTTTTIVSPTTTTGPNGGEEQWGPCQPIYPPDCDDFWFAEHLEGWGLRLLSNSSYTVNNPTASDEWFLFTHGGFGDPFELRLFRPDEGTHEAWDPSSEGEYSNGQALAGGIVATHVIPVSGEQALFNQSSLALLDLDSGQSTRLPYSATRSFVQLLDFERPWVVVLELALDPETGARQGQSGLWAFNIETDVMFPIYEGGGERIGPPAGERIKDAHVVDGYAYYTFTEFDDPGWHGTIKEMDLETRQVRTIMNLDQEYIQTFDAKGRYVVAPGVMDGAYRLLVYDRDTEDLLDLTEAAGGVDPDPHVGGEWVIWTERWPDRSDVVGIHIPTMTKHVIVDDYDGRIVTEATDGDFIIISLEAPRFTRLPEPLAITQMAWTTMQTVNP